MNSSTNLQSLVRSISGGGSINIFNQVNTQQNNAYLSKEEAFKMIEESKRRYAKRFLKNGENNKSDNEKENSYL